MENNEEINSIFNEINILNSLTHQNIVKIKNSFFLKKQMEAYIVMEYYDGGELLGHLIAKGRFDEDLAKNYFKQMISAIHYTHQRSIIH